MAEVFTGSRISSKMDPGHQMFPDQSFVLEMCDATWKGMCYKWA